MSNTPPPPPMQSPSGPPSGPASTTGSSKGLIARVFDLSFSEFVTPSIVKIIFIIGIIGAGLVSLVILVSFASRGVGAAVVGIILAAFAFAFYVLLARVLSELYLILFKIEENTRPDR